MSERMLEETRELRRENERLSKQSELNRLTAIDYDSRLKQIETLRKGEVERVASLLEQRNTLKTRLEVAEKIMAQLFIEPDDDEIFKEYCKLCSEEADCEWGDNFPYCLSSSALKPSTKGDVEK